MTCLGCAPASPAAPPPRPHAFVGVVNLMADEGESSRYELAADRTVEIVTTGSTGSQHEVRTTCRGTVPEDIAGGWLARLQSEATHPNPVAVESAPVDGYRPNFRFVAGYSDATTARYADPTPWRDELQPWLKALREVATSCETDESE